MVLRATALLAGVFAVTLAAVATAANDSSIANGRAIFQTGRDLQGHQIHAARPPMHPTCAACHRVNGAGGMKLPGGAVSADLRHGALSHMQHPYTLALLERAISKGIDSDGKPLAPVMPRWQLSSKDLHDVAQYVLTQMK
ncbi:MAG TPA: cytochrome c [Candidatus Elarobacter sp.]|jgi:mono/diheme cytochrome c family protein|nr:cytochrome c [Candidatus Elarobacter sp.]